MTTTIVVKNWDKFQHYSDRDPPWIKLYRDVLTTEAWVLGTDVSRLLQIAITLLAARYKNAIPNSFALIKKVASLDFSESQFKKAVEHLSSLKFLEIQGVEHSASNGLAPCYPREEREIREDLDQIRSDQKDMSTKVDPVREVFEHWKVVWNHPRSALDAKRTTTIKEALKGYSVADLCASISGYLHSTHHTGQNDRQTVYDDIALFLRDSAHIDAGLRAGDNPQSLTSELANHNVRVLQDWSKDDATTGYAEISNDDGSPGGGVRKAALPAAH